LRPSGISRLSVLKRRTITLLCFLMATSMLVSVFIFIDSSSIDEWDEYNDIGPVAMRVQGDGLGSAIQEIKDTAHVKRANIAETAQAYLRMDKNVIYQGSPTDPLDPMFLLVGQAYSLDADFIESFPTEFEVTVGRYPQNSSEIAIPESDAIYWGIPIGRMMNYSHTLNSEKRSVFVVGFFKVSEDPLRSVVTDAIAIVTSDVLNQDTVKTQVYIDINRDIITPVDPKGGLVYLREIESAIIDINPSASFYDRYYIDDYLAIKIQAYIDFVTIQRIRQLSRIQLLILIAGMFSFLGTRFNVIMREEELTNLKSRGASNVRLLRIVMSELWIMSFLSCGFGIILGLIMSKLALTTNGYLNFNFANIFDTPILLTYDTLAVLGIAGGILPIFGCVANRVVRTVAVRESEYGKLARLTKGIRLIRWDISIIILVSILFVSLYIGGPLFNNNPVLSLLAILSTIPLFIAIASIFTKILQLLVRPVSRIFKRIIGSIPAHLGIRGVTNNARIVIPVILIVTIAFSSSLTYDVIANSLPATQLTHSRYIIGGDLSFHLENDEYSQWSSFTQTVQNQQDVINTSLLSIGHLSLSDGPSGVIEYVAINPQEYSHVGYDSTGNILANSAQAPLLQDLATNPEGAILTSDIASEYNLIPGDTLRVFSFGDTSGTVEFNILGVTNFIPRPITSGEPSSDSVVGARKIWLNSQYVGTLVDLNEAVNAYLCVKTSDGANATAIGISVLTEFGTEILAFGRWSSSTADLDAYVSQENYSLDRSLDSMLNISMLCSVFVAFVTFQICQQYKGRGERALLKSMGVSKNQITRIKFAESFTLVVLSLILVIIFGSLNVANLLRVCFIEYSVWSYVFPISLFVSINWFNYLLNLGSIVIASIFLIMLLSWRSSIEDIAGNLRVMFQESNNLEGLL